jgi:hypothetical protein
VLSYSSVPNTTKVIRDFKTYRMERAATDGCASTGGARSTLWWLSEMRLVPPALTTGGTTAQTRLRSAAVVALSSPSTMTSGILTRAYRYV